MTNTAEFLAIIQVNIHEAKAHLPKLLQKVLEGEEIIIAKDNRPIPKLVLLEEQKSKHRLESTPLVSILISMRPWRISRNTGSANSARYPCL
ncbi:type II toxin-antitoxin system Phd/YefM family antitoxin [Nitrosococcus oceani]|uniref:type II toxin-antitoxin system Phd/YefM family antitoxin n=1 Tax=Nitrosococcus oceani TaxID=1229 RepID=UPI0011BE06C7